MRLLAAFLAILIIALAPAAMALPTKGKKAIPKKPRQYACIRITDDREPIIYIESI